MRHFIFEVDMLMVKEYNNLYPSFIFSEIARIAASIEVGKFPKYITFSNGIKTKYTSKLRLFAQGHTHCICCGRGKRESDKHFEYSHEKGLNLFFKHNWKSVMLTVDHDLLSSLGGIAQTYNLNIMCEECNNLRGNSFAQVEEFIYWFNHPKRKPITQKNFSYIDGRQGEREKFKPYSLPFDE